MKLGRIIAINLFLLFGLLLLGDLALWILAPVNVETGGPQYLAFNQTLPGVQSRVTYTRNRYGFRSQSMTSRLKNDGSIRVFCLGASTTDQPTQDTDNIWCSLLGSQLESDIDFEVESAALGRGGWRAVNLLRWVNRNIDTYEPDFVIVLMGINDLSWNGGPDYRYQGPSDLLTSDDAEPSPPSERTRLVERVKRVCMSISQLCQRVVLAKRILVSWFAAQSSEDGQPRTLEWHSANLPRLRERYRQLPYVPNPIRDPDPIHEFRDAMSILAETLKSRAIGTIIAGQPVLWKSDMTPEEQGALWFSVGTPNGSVRASGEWLSAEIAKYNDAQKQVAETQGLTYVDLEQQIPRTLNYFFDDCHFTDLGNRRVAQVLAPVLRELIVQDFGAQALAGSP